MSITIGATSPQLAMTGTGGPTAMPVAVSGSGLPLQGQVYAGQQMAQPGGVGSILKKFLIGGVAGGALGAGIGAVAGLILGPLGTMQGAIWGGAIGAAAGALIGLVKGIRDNSKQRLALQGPIPVGAGVNPATGLAAIPQGETYKIGATGKDVKWTQNAMKKLGVYNGKITGKFDKATADAIRHYELMKGAMPTGTSSPDLRKALAVDIRLSRSFM